MMEPCRLSFKTRLFFAGVLTIIDPPKKLPVLGSARLRTLETYISSISATVVEALRRVEIAFSMKTPSYCVTPGGRAGVSIKAGALREAA
jgi:hypothetical protein